MEYLQWKNLIPYFNWEIRMLVLVGHLLSNHVVHLTRFLLFCGFYLFFHVKGNIKHKCYIWSDFYLFLNIDAVCLKNKNEAVYANHNKALNLPKCFSK